MRIAFVIIRSFGALDHADIKQHHPTADPVNLTFSHLDVFLPHNIIVDLIQLRRHDLVDKFLPEHPKLIVITVFDLFTEIFQFPDHQIVKRIVIT